MIFYLISSFIFGAMIGSFLNVVIHRLPLKQDIVFKGSHCPKCQNSIPWYLNIPIVSYLILLGKCKFCGEKIKIRYLAVEVITGLFCSLAFFQTATFSFNVLSVNWIEFLWLFAITCLLICHFFIDVDHQILPDSLNLILLILIGIKMAWHTDWSHWLLGGLLGFGATYLVTLVFYLVRKQQGMGGGDIKLYGVLGMLFGPVGIMKIIFLSCTLGSLIILGLIGLGKVKREDPVAFGPSIIAVALVQIYFPKFFTYIFPFV